MFMVMPMKPNPIEIFSLSSSVESFQSGLHKPADQRSTADLEIFVIFTSVPETEAAVHAAGGLAHQLSAHLRLVMPYEVSYRLPLDRPPVSLKFLEEQLAEAAAHAGVEVEVDAKVCLCRDRKHALLQLLPPNALVIVGDKKRWWPTAQQKLWSALAKSGHQMVFAGV